MGESLIMGSGVRINKIAQAPSLDGSETILIIKDGRAYRGSIQDISTLVSQGAQGPAGPGLPHDERLQENTAAPILDNWNMGDAAIYGNYPRLTLLVTDRDGNEYENKTAVANYMTDRTDPDNPVVTSISWDLSEPTNCRILIN